jgi:nucleoid DNA-binding protein
MDTQYKNIIDKLAKKHSLPVFIIEEIVNSQFKFLRDKVISTGEHKSYRLTNLGMFTISPRKLKWIQNHNMKKKKSNGDIHTK